MDKRKKFTFWTSMFLMIALLLAACGSNESDSSSNTDETNGGGEASTELDPVNIQLKWVPQAQFAGVFVAKEKGFFEEQGIDVEIIPGGPDVIIEQQVVNGAADVGITAVDSLLVNRDNGLPIISIGQILQKSSNRLVAKKSTGIDSVEKMKGKKIGSWMGSQQFQVLAFLEKHGLNPQLDIELVRQGFTMDQFFNDQLDVASASIYNEYHVILENSYTEDDLYVYSVEDAGTAMLEDVLIATEEWAEDNRDLAIRTVRAVIQGWQYAIENQEEAIDIVMSEITDGSSTREHQETMLEEIARLILPEGSSPDEIGKINQESYEVTAKIAEDYELVSEAIDLASVYDETIPEEAIAGME
ncbi:ABC transporter substrate-binding protein [Halalkalibacter oceani]|uniref:ABC transporter substrate-binding protein n=1 Tax=Halalkalibacter oceani TaxID=1653776 RepID=UPI003391A876